MRSRFIPLMAALFTVLIVFHKAIEGVIFESASTMLDEALILMILALALVTYKRSKFILLSFVPLVLFYIYCVLISLATGSNNSAFEIFVQSFLHIQFYLLFISLAAIHYKYNKYALQTTKIVFITAVVGALIQFLIPDLLASLIGDTRYTLRTDTFGLFRWEGFQKNPNALGYLFCIIVILCLFRKDVYKNRRRQLLALFFAFVGMILTGSSSAVIFVILALLFLPIKNVYKIGLGILAVGVAVQSSQILSMYDKLSGNLALIASNPDQSQYARWLMTYNGFKLLIEYFPIGTGAGSFGTAFSRESIVYRELGIHNVWLIRSERGIQDSNAGAIAGEFGFLGVLFIYGYLFYCVNRVVGMFTGNGLKSCVKNEPFVILFVTIILLAGFIRPIFISSYYSVLICLCFFAYFETRRGL